MFQSKGFLQGVSSIVFAFAALFCAASASQAQLTAFSPVVNVSNTSGDSNSAQVAVDSKGNVDVIWLDNTPGNYAVFFSRSTDGGATFSTPMNVSNQPSLVDSLPHLAVDASGNIYIVWQVGTSSNSAVFFSGSTNGGKSFSTPQQLSIGSEGVAPSLVVDSAGGVDVAWAGNTPVTGIFFTRSANQGGTFSIPTDISNQAGSMPNINADPAGDIYAVWVGCSTSSCAPPDVYFSVSTDFGASFSAPTNVSNNGHNGYAASPQVMAASLSNINVTWIGNEIGIAAPYYAFSSDGGNTFMQGSGLGADEYDSIPESAMDSAGGADSVEGTGDGDEGGAVIFGRYINGTLVSRTFLAHPFANTIQPQIATDSHNGINVVFAAPLGRGEQSGVAFTRSADAGSTFSNPQDIPGGADGGDPQITTDGGGNVYVVWVLANNSNNEDVYFARSTGMSVFTSLTFSPTTVIGGTPSTGTITLASPAPAGGLVATLSSSDTAVATVPASVTFEAGSTTATFTAQTSAVSTMQPITITATYGDSSVSGTFSAIQPETVQLSGFPPGLQITGGQPLTITAAFNGSVPAPAGGTTVALSSGDPTTLSVPSSVTIPAGALSTTFIVTGGPVSSPSIVALSLTEPSGSIETYQITVEPAAPGIISGVTLNPSTVIEGGTSTATVTLKSPAPAGGITFVTSSNSQAASTPGTVFVPSGATSATFTVQTSSVTTSTTATIFVNYDNAVTSATLTVNPYGGIAVSSLTLNPSSVSAGTSSTATVTLSSPAPAGGQVVCLTSHNTDVASVPASITIAAAATTGRFDVTTYSVPAPTIVGISACVGPSSMTSDLTVMPTSPSFTVAANPSSLTIPAPGMSASTTLTFTSKNGFAGSGTLTSSTCGTAASEQITCTLSAFTLPANGTATATLTVSTTAGSSALSPAIRKLLLTLLLCGLATPFAMRRKQRRLSFAFAAIAFAVLMTSTGCGSSSTAGNMGTGTSDSGTPVGAVQSVSVPVTINGTTVTVPNLTITVE